MQINLLDLIICILCTKVILPIARLMVHIPVGGGKSVGKHGRVKKKTPKKMYEAMPKMQSNVLLKHMN